MPVVSGADRPLPAGSCNSAWRRRRWLDGAPAAPIIISHRARPDIPSTHSPATTAAEMARFRQADLVDEDGVLIAPRERISGTTDAADRFPDRRRTKEWTASGDRLVPEDFTLAGNQELRRAAPALPIARVRRTVPGPDLRRDDRARAAARTRARAADRRVSRDEASLVLPAARPSARGEAAREPRAPRLEPA